MAEQQNDRRKTMGNMDKNILNQFWNLVEINPADRVNAAHNIIRILQQKQPENKHELCLELQYTVDRLVKGISSVRKAARQGYALALTAVLKVLPVVPISDVLNLMEKHLKLTNKQEKSQMVIGRMLTYAAIIRSGRLRDDLGSLPTVVVDLFCLSLGKCYIQETTYMLISHLFAEVEEEDFKQRIWPKLKKKLSCGWENCTPDIFWLLLLCCRMYPNTVQERFMQKYWGCSNILSSESYDEMQKIIKKCTSVHPQFSPVCSELLHIVNARKKTKKIWNAVFDEGLFSADQDERAYLGFRIIREALCNMSSEKMVPCIISSSFSLVFTRCLLSNKHPLNSAASELASFLADFVQNCNDPESQLVILKAFIQPPGTMLLEQMLSKKEVSIAVKNLSYEAVKLYCEFLKNLVLEKPVSEEEDEAFNRKCCHAISQIGALVSHVAVMHDLEWRQEVVKFLFLHSFFEVKEDVEDIDSNWIPRRGTEIYPLDASVRQNCMHSFNRALDSLNRKSDISVPPLDQRISFLKSLADFSELLLEFPNQVSPLQPLEKVQKPWNCMMRMVDKLTKQSLQDGKNVESAAFQIFFLHLGFQLFSDADHIPGILEELQVCCKKAIRERERKVDVIDNGDPPWLQVVVDVMLSLISQESHHMRCVVNSVFSLISPFITHAALDQILDVINPEKLGESALAEDSEDDDTDAEFESGSSSEEHEEQNGGVENVMQLKSKLQKVLGEPADISDAESEVMTDSEMTQLDDALSAAFQSQKKVGHLQFSAEQERLMHFRLRCLDLISIYMKTEPSLSLVLQCIQPVLETYMFGLHSRHQRVLSQKAHSTLETLIRTKKFRDCQGVESQEVRTLLQDLIDKANKESSAPAGKLLSSLCVYMVLCERKLWLPQCVDKNGKVLGETSCLAQYRVALDTFATKANSHLTPHLFVTLMNACPETAWSLVEPLQRYAFDETVRLFKKAQCLGLLISALKFSKGQKSVTAEMWHDACGTIAPQAVKTLKLMLSGKSNIKPTYTIELLEVLVTIIQLTKEKCDEDVIIEDKEELLEVLTGLHGAGDEKKRIGSAMKKTVNKLIRLLGGEVPTAKTQKKRKASKDEESQSVNTKKSKIQHIDSMESSSQNMEVCDDSEVEENNNDSASSSEEDGNGT